MPQNIVTLWSSIWRSMPTNPLWCSTTTGPPTHCQLLMCLAIRGDQRTPRMDQKDPQFLDLDCFQVFLQISPQICQIFLQISPSLVCPNYTNYNRVSLEEAIPRLPRCLHSVWKILTRTMTMREEFLPPPWTIRRSCTDARSASSPPHLPRFTRTTCCSMLPPREELSTDFSHLRCTTPSRTAPLKTSTSPHQGREPPVQDHQDPPSPPDHCLLNDLSLPSAPMAVPWTTSTRSPSPILCSRAWCPTPPSRLWWTSARETPLSPARQTHSVTILHPPEKMPHCLQTRGSSRIYLLPFTPTPTRCQNWQRRASLQVEFWIWAKNVATTSLEEDLMEVPATMRVEATPGPTPAAPPSHLPTPRTDARARRTRSRGGSTWTLTRRRRSLICQVCFQSIEQNHWLIWQLVNFVVYLSRTAQCMPSTWLIMAKIRSNAIIVEMNVRMLSPSSCTSLGKNTHKSKTSSKL